MNRVLAAARLQVVRPLVILGVPWLVALSSFAINWAVWDLADLRTQAPQAVTGGVLALYVTVMVVFVQAVTQLLPFAMGISLTRRAYYLGVALVGVLSAVGYGLVLALLGRLEAATDGWGIGLHFWVPRLLTADGFLVQVVVCGVPMLAFIAAGAGIGIAVKRFGPNGAWGLILGLLVALGALAILVTWLRAWHHVGAWFLDQSLLTLAVGIPVALTALLAALSWVGLRRVVP